MLQSPHHLSTSLKKHLFVGQTNAKSFSQLKFLLCSAPVLCYLRFDREFLLQTDASDFGVGAVLSQIDDNGCEKVVAYASKASSAQQKKFSATKKKLMLLFSEHNSFVFIY